MARISTHILDTARGKPAAGMHVRLFSVEGETLRLLTSAITNPDGRTDEPLLTGDRIATGVYELAFAVSAYFQLPADPPPFLGEVRVRFGVADPQANYHVPLLVSPYAYSTYRGS